MSNVNSSKSSHPLFPSLNRGLGAIITEISPNKLFINITSDKRGDARIIDAKEGSISEICSSEIILENGENG